MQIFSHFNNSIGNFSKLKALNYITADINKLTIMPNSVLYSYMTAGYTDGKTYIQDMAISNKPIYILAYGPPLKGIRINDAKDNIGAKFTAYGSSLDHFYTSSSNGVIKVQNIRSEKKAKSTVILKASIQISFNAFSPDCSKLIISNSNSKTFDDKGQNKIRNP